MPAGDERMDDSDLSPLIGVMALGVMLAAVAAVAWLLVPMSHVTNARSDQAGISARQVSPDVSTPARRHDRLRRCVDAAVSRGGSGCAAAPSASPTPPAHRSQRSARPGAVAVTPTRTPEPSAPLTPQPTLPATPPAPATTPQPSAPQPTTPAPAPPQQPSSHHGPVPGGSTSPPHTGPRP